MGTADKARNLVVDAPLGKPPVFVRGGQNEKFDGIVPGDLH